MADEKNERFPVRKDVLIKFLNGFGFIGALLILWGFVTIIVNRTALIERGSTIASIYIEAKKWTNFFGSLFSLIGVIGVCVTAYIKPHNRKADPTSLKIFTPIIVSFTIISLVFLIILKDLFPSVIIMGFTILATAGTMFRALPFSEIDPSTWDAKIEFKTREKY